MPTWPSPSSERLGTPKIPAIRFTRGTYFQASGSLVTLTAAGYNYNMDWTSFCWQDLHPLEWQLASLHQNKAALNPRRSLVARCARVVRQHHSLTLKLIHRDQEFESGLLRQRVRLSRVPRTLSAKVAA